MTILIIEDNQFKSDEIVSYLNKIGKYDITVKRSYNAALVELLTNRFYDIILLDISLPGFDEKDVGGNYMPAGGKHLFSQIYLNDIPAKVIVVTLYRRFDDGSEIEQLHENFRQNYHDSYLGYVLFNNNDNRWQSDLSNLIKVNCND